MTTEISSPFADIVARMAKQKVTGPVEKFRQRFKDATDVEIVVCDVSVSMTDFIGSAGMSKYDHLKIALSDVLAGNPSIRMVAFSNTVKEFKTLRDMPAATGCSTDLASALKYVAKLKPRKTIIISDGLPDDAAKATAAAAELTGIVDCIYCGPEAHPAVLFLQGLARDNGGTQVTWDGYRPLGPMVRGLLPAPAAK